MRASSAGRSRPSHGSPALAMPNPRRRKTRQQDRVIASIYSVECWQLKSIAPRVCAVCNSGTGHIRPGVSSRLASPPRPAPCIGVDIRPKHQPPTPFRSTLQTSHGCIPRAIKPRGLGMKKLILAGALAFVATGAQAQYYGPGSNSQSHTSSGYTTSRGTYVQPYVATNPNSTQRDNYSATGNVNPYTGAVGTRNPRY